MDAARKKPNFTTYCVSYIDKPFSRRIKMATIDFQVNYTNQMVPQTETLSGSGLGFFGETAGSSVQIGAFQDSTLVSNGDGSETTGQANNIKYVASTFPSGQCTVDSTGTDFNIGLSGVVSYQSTLGVRFGHTTAVKTQNCQLRIYDRTNINYPASGVNTKVAEIVNWNGTNPHLQGADGVASAHIGSGDAFWWGEPWPSELVGSQNFYENSLGTKFYNGLDTDSVVNGDSRIGNGVAVGDDETVGGTGIIVPLLDSPGSGQIGLKEITGPAPAVPVGGQPGMVWPKWSQYINSSSQSTWAPSVGSFDGDSTNGIKYTYGGTGLHTHHTWCVALSASPLAIGSKEQYGLYVSLEYL